MHRATLLAGDDDFKPLVDALIQDGMFVTLWYPPEETSRELMLAADARRLLTLEEIKSFLAAPSKEQFQLPRTEPKPALGYDPIGQVIAIWMHDGYEMKLFKTEKERYVIKVGGNTPNLVNIEHENLELLRMFCKETRGIVIPEVP
jgi:hypothetical protein